MAEYWADLSTALADLVELAGQSVVRVEARRRIPASGIVWSADGLIVTAHHVVHWDEDIRIGLPGGESTSAEIVGRDPSTDLALLKADAAGLAVPSWVGPDELRVGQLVLALGRPGRSVQASLGVLSAVLGGGEPRRRALAGRIEPIIRPDLVMYPGFSGGPLVTADGRLVGLNTSGLSRGGPLTVPLPTVRAVVEALGEHGRVRHGYLGISSQVVRLPGGIEQELGQQTGLMVVQVQPESPAERGGILLGDVLVTFDGTPTETLDDLLALLSGSRVGREVEVRVLRGGELRTLTVTVGERE
ncbi:MAG TPA: trypsin-like peptidase domain-containing protein [Aggregatilineales bacterium]|jgi:S1-C subfamily serine protease|nr:PDZ domain-containing protein [Chloroflexota bacterium]HOA24047.1 trypsin-like peptidase domain-containing protein [Aggregatilineales bacterium]HQA68131.1 trypsin-like peptidase domain-containing protein [Aggregatilineales bacterium]HQE17973.1 trypsin-like peptidase domain-containing protein [Aggregatilineales bacterium]